MANYVYICSSRFSGSTLLGLLLGSHSSIATIGELSSLSRNLYLQQLCGCGTLLNVCPVWSRVINEINVLFKIDILDNPYKLNLGFRFPENEGFEKKFKFYKIKGKIFRAIKFVELRYDLSFLNLFSKTFDEIINNNKIIYDLMAKILNKKIVIDTSKDYLIAISFYKKFPQNTKIILLVRDGRGVFYSGLKRKDSFKNSILTWKRYYERALPLLKKHLSSDFLLVKYEDLVLYPEKTLKKICQFLEVNFEKDMLKFRANVQHIVGGNPMKFRKTSILKLDNSWKYKLSEKQKNLFESIAGNLNRKFGYE